MAWEKNWVIFENVRFIKTSASGKAILVEMFGEDTWIPRSQMEDDGSDGEIEEIENSGRLVVSEWIADQKDLVEKREKYELKKKAAKELEGSSKLPEDDDIDGVFGPKPPDPQSTAPWASGEYTVEDTDLDELDKVFGPPLGDNPLYDNTITKSVTATRQEIEQGNREYEESVSEEEMKSGWGETIKASRELLAKRGEKIEATKKATKKETKPKPENKTVSLWGEASKK